VADEHDLFAGDPPQAARNGLVVAVEPVAVEFLEFLDEGLDVIGGLRPVGVAGHLHGFPRGERGVLLADHRDKVLAHVADFGARVHAARAT
jgi:hypothetical protein